MPSASGLLFLTLQAFVILAPRGNPSGACCVAPSPGCHWEHPADGRGAQSMLVLIAGFFGVSS